ncbi:DNA primase family protein [Sporosarcina sp. SAFN-010]|uniref:DNA primase family protein n=1 Tax=Sporosarcina sp. SAFN-010 TaxID=3387273 RepID=UPI003F7DCF99
MNQNKELDEMLVASFLTPYQVKNMRLLATSEKTKKLLESIQEAEQLSILVTALQLVVSEGSEQYFNALLYGFNQTPPYESARLYKSALPISDSLISEELVMEIMSIVQVSNAEGRGFYYDEEQNKFKFNANAFAKHFVTRCSMRSTKDGRLFLYNYKGVYEELLEVELGKIIRIVMHEGVWNSWKSSYEAEAVKALLREAVTVDEMNNQKDFINLTNGMLNLNTMKLLPHSASYLSTVQIPIDFNPQAEAPKFQSFLRDITLNDAELITVIQEFLGYILSGETKAEKAFYLFGGGANGKSVLATIITHLVGKENISSIPLAEFGQRFGLEGLINKSVNIAAENELGGKALKTENFKAIVSGDVINIEVKYRSSIAYKPHCKLVFLVNSLPDSMDVTNGYFRKLMIIPFRRTFKPEERNVNLTNELLEELSGILNWAMIGLHQLKQNKYQFSSCKAIEHSHQAYYAEQNPVKEFFLEHVQVTEGGRTRQAEFHEKYLLWLSLQGIDDKGTKSKQNFWRYLKIVLENEAIAISKKKVRGTIYYEGLTIVGLDEGTQSLSLPVTVRF